MKRSDITPDLQLAAFEFLFRFSRFEYALKNAGYLKSTDTGKKAEPNWDAFVKRNRTRYALSSTASALIAARPRQQVVAGNAQMSWQELQFAATEYDLQKVTLLLRLVRNNLFHGGKPADPRWDDPQKTAALLETCQAVLNELAVFANFNDAYERTAPANP